MLVSLAASGILPGFEKARQFLKLPTNAFGWAIGALAMVAADDAECRVACAPSSLAFPWQLPILSNQQQQAAALELRDWCLACVSKPISLCHCRP